MLGRNMWVRGLAVLMAMGMLLCGGPIALALETAAGSGDMDITLSYKNNMDTESTGFIYNDSMLLVDAHGMSTDLAKASAALAMAAYDQDFVYDALDDMDFLPIDGAFSYYIADEAGIFDCDHVGYTIAQKMIGDYMVYMVPVRGTAKNSEWFSDFDLGTTGNHKGFYAAAEEVKVKLYSHLRGDGIAADKTIIWTMGHSRGAAVSNIIAGELTQSEEFAPAGQIFSYNFACPAVTRNGTAAYDNIYNFNGAGDLVPSVPLSNWGYERYGQTITLNRTLDDNFLRRYEEVTGDTFSAAATTSGYRALFTALVQTEEDFHDPTVRLAIMTVAYALGGSEKATLLDVLQFSGYDAGDLLWDMFSNANTVLSLLSGIQDVSEGIPALLSFYAEHEAAVAQMTDEEFAVFKREHGAMFSKINGYLGRNIETKADYTGAKGTLRSLLGENESIGEMLGDFLSIFLSADGNVLGAVEDAHTQSGYVLAINSKYYGYEGWRGSEIDRVSVPSNCTTIGTNCFYECENLGELALPDGLKIIGPYAFYNCSKLETLEIPRSVEYIGVSAFASCSGLVEVTLPVEQSVSGIFGNVSNVEHIHYTCGSDGLMPDRVSHYSQDGYYYANTLEYYSRRNLKYIDFEEGVRRIGAYAYFYDWSAGALEDVKLPSTLESVGAYAFYDQPNLTQELVLPEGFHTLGEYSFYKCAFASASLPETLSVFPAYCFYGCSAMDTDLPGNTTDIGESAFSDCAAIDILVIPKSIQNLGANAFANCSGLVEVTLPVEYSIAGVFTNDANVERMHYTCGSDGLMPDRVSHYSQGGHYYANTLEYYSRRNLKYIDFEEGVRRIGAYAYFYDWSAGVLEDVKLPSTLESVGAYAFYDQPNLTQELVLPEGFHTLGEYSFYKCAFASASLPETLSVFPAYCFYGCSGMDTDLPGNTTDIGESAFSDCAAIDTLVIPKSIQNLGANAFANCSGLVEVTLPVEYSIAGVFTNDANVERMHYTCGSDGLMPDRASHYSQGGHYYANTLEYYSRRNLKYIDFEEGVRRIGAYAYFYDWSAGALEDVKLPSTLESVGAYAFYDQPNLTQELVLPEGLHTLGEYAFFRCNISGLSLPSTLRHIPEYCFAECANFDTLVVPPTVMTMDRYPFWGCLGVKHVEIPVELSQVYVLDSVQVEDVRYTVNSTGVMPDRIQDNWNNDTSWTLEGKSWKTLKTVEFSEGVKRIGACAFDSGVNEGVLTSIKLPASLESIGDYAFYCHPNLAIELVLPEGMCEIGMYSFYGCGFTGIHLPASLADYPEGCFDGCGAAKEILLPEGVQSIGSVAFRNCKSVQKLVIPNSVQSIGRYAFEGLNSLQHLTIPVEMSAPYTVTCGWTPVLETVHYTVGSTGVMPDREDGFPYRSTPEFSGQASLKTILFDEGVKHIGDRAFYHDDDEGGIENVVLPGSLESIGDYAFYGQKQLIDPILLPNGFKELGVQSFAWCAKLKGVDIPEGVEEIPAGCFHCCYELCTDLPESLRRIDDDAFTMCKMSENGHLVIPRSVEHVGKNAFIWNGDVTEITLPVELDAPDAFNLENLQAIHYVVGSTGIMPDRSSDDNAENNYFKYIENKATQLISVDFEEGVKRIGACAYFNDRYTAALKQVSLPGTLESIGDYAFCSRQSIQPLAFPASLKEIGKNAFAGCLSMKEITFEGPAPAIAEDAFSIGWDTVVNAYYKPVQGGWTADVLKDYGTPMTWIAVGDDIGLSETRVDLVLSDHNFGGSLYLTLSYNGANANADAQWITSDKNVVRVEKGRITAIGGGSATVTAILDQFRLECEVQVHADVPFLCLPAMTRTIEKEAFAGMTQLRAAVLGEQVTSIGENAFAGCEGLLVVNIPSGVSEIAEGAFDGCGSLRIYCTSGSEGQRYAAANGIPYEIINAG